MAQSERQVVSPLPTIKSALTSMKILDRPFKYVTLVTDMLQGDL